METGKKGHFLISGDRKVQGDDKNKVTEIKGTILKIGLEI
jgi:hypothetical protein